ncbi:MAG: Nif3-like dinuclear metal center hexameric protein [Desulfobacterales bacterium]|nr:Nif3-like dinuclear metal center hexameric protein [Desulfobacterales bacterium]
MKIKDILTILNRIAPFDLTEKWDNSGLQAGNPEAEVDKIITGLDVTMALLNEARERDAGLVLTHHPLMISPEKTFDFNQMPGSAIREAAIHNISIVSVHTNLDKAENGLNDYFATRIGVEIKQAFLPHLPLSGDLSSELGIGRLGRLEKKIRFKTFAKETKDRLGLPNIRITGNPDNMVREIAVCTGSGGSLVRDFIGSGADVYVTGDVKYHEARQVEEASKNMIDVGHFGSEHMAVELLSNRLNHVFEKNGVDLEVIPFLKEKDPFTIV